MSGENKTLTGQFAEVGFVHHSGESASDGEENLRSEPLDRRMTSSEIDRKINPIVAPLSSQLELLILSMRELDERSSTRSTGGIVGSERSTSSGQPSKKSSLNFYLKLPNL